jgi:hypothetical protein
MYIIQVDEQSWFVDTCKGWLQTTPSPQRAAMFTSQEEAQEVAERIQTSSGILDRCSILSLG